MVGAEEFSFISHLEGTSIVSLGNLEQAVPGIVARQPLLVGHLRYEELRQQEEITGHPDCFYRIGQVRKQVSKFGFKTSIGVTPVVLNSLFFDRGGDYSDLIPLTLVRANSEIRTILTNITDFFDPNSDLSIHEQMSVAAWKDAFNAAQKLGKLDRFVAFYQDVLKTTGEPLSSDEKYNQEELRLLDLALNDFLPKTPAHRKGILDFLWKKK